MADELYISMG